jgi:hypothetical protein
MLEIKKIEEKVELKDLEVQSDPCKYFWNKSHVAGLYDCLEDCLHKTPKQSVCY